MRTNNDIIVHHDSMPLGARCLLLFCLKAVWVSWACCGCVKGKRACPAHHFSLLLVPTEGYVQVAAAHVLQAIARSGGVALWGGGGYEETLRLCIAHLDDGVKAVGDAFAVAMGEIAASRTSIAAQQAVRPWQP
jgi:hypothetical protein